MIAETETSARREGADDTLQRLAVYPGEPTGRCAPTVWKCETHRIAVDPSVGIYRTTPSYNAVQDR